MEKTMAKVWVKMVKLNIWDYTRRHMPFYVECKIQDELDLVITHKNESLEVFLKMCKNGRKCLKTSWKSTEWDTKLPEIRKFPENPHAWIIIPDYLDELLVLLWRLLCWIFHNILHKSTNIYQQDIGTMLQVWLTTVLGYSSNVPYVYISLKRN